MITSKLEDGVVWLIIEGELVADEVLAEAAKWLPQKDTFAGFITDIKAMTKQTVAEQKKLEEGRKNNKSGKPNAILGKDSAFAVLAKIYIRFTNAENVRYFTDPDEAKAWLKNFH